MQRVNPDRNGSGGCVLQTTDSGQREVKEDMEQETPIRILHVFGKLNRGGAESRVMDLYRHIDRTKVQFDFLVHFQSSCADPDTLATRRPKEDLDDEVLSMGGRIYVLPRFTGTNLGQYKRACKTFFAAHHDFAAVEGHMTSMASVYLPIAKASGVPVVMAHARSAGVDAGLRGLATRWLRRSLPEKCDRMLSCSREASVSVFGRKAYEEGKIMLVPNALELAPFFFDEEKRRRVRASYGIPDDAVVIGHVGRLDAVKNHCYLAGVGKALEGREIRFLFAGKGALQQQIQRTFEDAGLGAKVIWTGQLSREETAAVYQAFDVFAFPSLYEGMPGTVIEAQAAGLPCVIADTITDEAVLTNLVIRLPIGADHASQWAQEIQKRTATTDAEQGLVMAGDMAGRRAASARAGAALDAAGYNVETAAIQMQKFYMEL